MSKSISNDVIDLSIKAGSTITNGYNLQKKSIMSIQIPADWDGGDITIQSSLTPEANAGWKVVNDSDGTAIGLTTVVADTIITMANNELQALMQLKFIRFKSASAVSAARTLQISLKEV